MRIAASLLRALINNAVPRGPRIVLSVCARYSIRSVMTDALSLLPEGTRERGGRVAYGERGIEWHEYRVTLRHDYIAF